MFKQVYVLDVTDTKGNIRAALDEYSANSDTYNGCYFHLNMFDLLDYEENENVPEAKLGWQELQSELKKANIFEFYVHCWW